MPDSAQNFAKGTRSGNSPIPQLFAVLSALTGIAVPVTGCEKEGNRM
jgi:hypothetical protein